jgi:hypothetical protein
MATVPHEVWHVARERNSVEAVMKFQYYYNLHTLILTFTIILYSQPRLNTFFEGHV